MTKRPEIGVTDGKVTYIHCAAPMRAVTMHSVTVDQLVAAEQDISQHAYEFPPQGLRVRPDAPSISVYAPAESSAELIVDRYFGIPEPQSAVGLWDPDPRAANSAQASSLLHSIAMAVVLTALVAALAVGFVQLWPHTVFPEFLATTHLPQ